jgi:hypothetical protein
MTLLTLRPTVAPRLTASSKTGRISLIPATTPATVDKARHLAHFCNKARHLAHLYNRPQHSSKLSKPLLNWMRQPDKCSSNFKKTSCANSRCSTRSGIIMPEKWRPSPQT